VRHDSYVRVTWPVQVLSYLHRAPAMISPTDRYLYMCCEFCHMCDMTPARVWRDWFTMSRDWFTIFSYMCYMNFIHICVKNRAFDSSMCYEFCIRTFVMNFIHIFVMNHDVHSHIYHKFSYSYLCVEYFGFNSYMCYEFFDSHSLMCSDFFRDIHRVTRLIHHTCTIINGCVIPLLHHSHHFWMEKWWLIFRCTV